MSGSPVHEGMLESYLWLASPEVSAASLKRLVAAMEEAAGSAPS